MQRPYLAPIRPLVWKQVKTRILKQIWTFRRFNHIAHKLRSYNIIIQSFKYFDHITVYDFRHQKLHPNFKKIEHLRTIAMKNHLSLLAWSYFYWPGAIGPSQTDIIILLSHKNVYVQCWNLMLIITEYTTKTV